MSEWRASADAPAAWIEYATKLRLRAEAVLGAQDEVALGFRDRLEQIYELASVTNSDPAESIAVNLWVSPDGQIDRATLAAFPSAGMDPNLRVLLSRISVGPPPPDMLQPVRLQLRLAAGKSQAKP